MLSVLSASCPKLTTDPREGRAILLLGGWGATTLSWEILTAFGESCFMGVSGLAFVAVGLGLSLNSDEILSVFMEETAPGGR